MSYQPEERYWTDYLRIALPVVGLLLMLGLFWFWATNLIGDDDDDDPPATVEVAGNPPTATPTQAPAEPTEDPGVDDARDDGDDPTPTEPSDDDGSDDDNGDGGDETPVPTETEEPEDPTPPEGTDDGGIGAGDIVIVNSDEVNFRPAPNTVDTPIRVLDNGEELTVTGPLEESDDGNQWYPVIDKDGVEGYVAAQFVDPA